MEKKLLKNLQAYIETGTNIPVVLFDSNEDRNLPVIALGIETIDIHPILDANATVEGYAMIGYRGTQDPDMVVDSTVQTVKGMLQDTSLYSSMNKPTGTDTRPCSGFHLELLTITGTERKEEEHSTLVFISWDAFIANQDG